MHPTSLQGKSPELSGMANSDPLASFAVVPIRS